MITEPRYATADLDNFRKALAERESFLTQNLHKARLEALREVSPDGTGEVSHRHTHPADDGGLETEQAIAVGGAERVANQLGEVRAAQQRLALGTYGICEECGQLISAQRLEKVPETRFCGPCQRSFEEEEKLHRHNARLDG